MRFRLNLIFLPQILKGDSGAELERLRNVISHLQVSRNRCAAAFLPALFDARSDNLRPRASARICSAVVALLLRLSVCNFSDIFAPLCRKSWNWISAGEYHSAVMKR
jgi:hypothetical protein